MKTMGGESGRLVVSSDLEGAGNSMHQMSSQAESGAGDTLFHQSIEGCLETSIGRHGLSLSRLEHYFQRLDVEIKKLQDNFRTGRLRLLTIPEDTEDLDEAARALEQLSQGADTIVFFGTGGSGLGGQTLAQLADENQGGRALPRIRFYDNLDPLTLEHALTTLDLAATRFVLTSKSGGTAETLAQAIVALEAVEAAGLGPRIPELFLAITEPAKAGTRNGLRAVCESRGIPALEHDTGIGGRFSCLTNVGLVPAMAAGLDAKAVRAGAREVVLALLAARRARDFAPAAGAAAAVGLAKDKGIRTLVMMPYADRLSRFASWFVQLWAESLGKNGEGTSPIAALGPLDQHSQLQLFMDGPRELYITVVRVAVAGKGPVIDRALAETAGIGFMGGRAIGDVVDAQSRAVVEALGKAKRPVRTIDIPKLDERAMGALLMHFMIETIFAGRLIGIDPFDQPAVELAKSLTKARLAHS